MENPLELPVPPEDEPIQRIRALARDIAYGAAHKMWTSHFLVQRAHDDAIFSDQGLNSHLVRKWGNYHNYYSVHLLVSFGYLTTESPIKDGDGYFALTEKAFALLEQPTIPPSVFISYARKSSSSFALLVEAKLRLRDSAIGVFIDKLIKPGDDWEENIKEKIKQSRYFICLLAPDTYTQSEWVRKELDWAYEAGCEIISVFHNGSELNDRYPVWLGKKQIVKVDFETAKHYESAIDEILVGLGYSTY